MTTGCNRQWTDYLHSCQIIIHRHWQYGTFSSGVYRMQHVMKILQKTGIADINSNWKCTKEKAKPLDNSA
jgi:hypothetical protein